MYFENELLEMDTPQLREQCIHCLASNANGKVGTYKPNGWTVEIYVESFSKDLSAFLPTSLGWFPPDEFTPFWWATCSPQLDVRTALSQAFIALEMDKNTSLNRVLPSEEYVSGLLQPQDLQTGL